MTISEVSADPRLQGALRKTVLPAGGGGVGWGGGGERMDETHLSVFHSVLNHAHGKRLRNSLFCGSVHFQLVFFFLKQETVRHSRYMIWLIFT